MLYKRVCSISIALLIVLGCAVTVSSDNNGEDNSAVPFSERFQTSQEGSAPEYRLAGYREVLEKQTKFGAQDYSGDPLNVNVSGGSLPDGKQITLEKADGCDAHVYASREGEAEAAWDFIVETAGFYNIEVGYLSLTDSAVTPIRTLMIDGETPFDEAAGINFRLLFEEASKPFFGSNGDEVAPSQREVKRELFSCLYAPSGSFSEPLKIYLKAGKHNISFGYVEQDMAVSHIRLTAPEEIPLYSERLEEYKRNGYKAASAEIVFEAEQNADLRNDAALRRVSSDDPLTTPYKAGSRRMNAIGDVYWKKGGQAITWRFNVETPGLYQISLRCVQQWSNGMPSFRQIEIDGSIPFKEMLAYSFSYGSDIGIHTLAKEGMPYQFYFDKAGIHTLTMTVVLGETGAVVDGMLENISKLSDILFSINMITGPDPDTNYDYDLEIKIPGLLKGLAVLSKALGEHTDKLVEIAGKTTPAASSLKQSKAKIDYLIASPDKIVKNIGELQNVQILLGTWFASLQEMPLLIDSFKLSAPNTEHGSGKSSFLQKLNVLVINFLRSFTKDYDSVGTSDENVKTLNVWVSRGIEWAEIMKGLSDTGFTPSHNVAVKLNLLPSGQLNASSTSTGQVNMMTLSIASGRAPDVAIGVDAGSPVEFAIRDAVVELSSLDGYEELSSQLLQGIMKPMKYKGGVYGIPETLSFRALYYRKDILSALNIKVPDTWTELYGQTLPVLYNNNLQFFCAQDFPLFLYQNNGSYYTPDETRSALDSREAYNAFKEMIELYTKYGIDYTTNFFSRFRSGEVPLGIGAYGEYMQFFFAAPEMAGRWGIAPVPAHVNSDGTLNRATPGQVGQAIVILNQSSLKKESWEFVRWWMSSQTQTEYAREIESRIGSQARWASANLSAFEKTSWKREDLAVIREQWELCREIPTVLGGYFTGRHVSNAWNRVVISGQPIRESLEEAVEAINREMRLKQEEYGVSK